jgi:F-type H+-transporting ATPase subunit alpha
LPGAKLNELILFETGDVGYVFSLNTDSVQVAILGRHKIPVSTRVTRTNKKLSFQFQQQGGMIVNPLGEVILGDLESATESIELPLFVDIPPLVERRNVKKQLITGISVIDVLLPIGQGQRELLVGDRQTGKRPVAMQACRSALENGLKVVYAMVAQNNSDIHLVYKYFQDHGISKDVHIIATSPLDSPCMIYVTPFSGMSVAEYYAQNGCDVLYIIEDLTTHAQFYREFALVSGRLPGRESYPGDIFYTHAHLLERAGTFSLKGKPETSITCLPMIHTAEGDLSTYISTNSIGITDGHLFFDKERYLKGVIPPIHVGLSVTRAGKQTQTQLLRDINRKLTTFLSEYENTASFSSFGSELSDAVKDVLAKGELFTVFLRQPDANPRHMYIDLVLLGLIWKKIYSDSSIDSFVTVRAQIGEFLKGDGASFKASIDAMKNMDELLNFIETNKETLIPICEIKKS